MNEAEAPTRSATDASATAPGERRFVLWLHLLPALLLAAAFASSGVLAPFPVLGAWVLWMVRRERSVYIDDHGREAMNFQITLLLYGIMAGLAGLLSCGTAWILGFPAIASLGLVGAILSVRAAQRGQLYRYPMTLRLLPPAI